LVRNPWFLLIFFGLLIFATRVHYDVRMSQPHPAAYALFVMQMRILSWLRFKRPESILLALAVHCGNRIFGGDSGFDLVKRNFPLTAAGPVYYTGLPAESGSRLLGEYEIAC